MVKKNSKKVYKAIDLFAGIGGIRLGFQKAFGNQVDFNYSNEIDDYCCQTYEFNFGENPKGDITKIKPDDLPDFDILMAGFPCQAFSIAGYKRGFDDIRGTLFFYVADILRKKQPEAFLLENVKHLANHDKGRTLQIIKDVLTKDLNYHIHVKILNAKQFGVPQNRERIFIIGFKKNFEFKFPTPPNIDVQIEDILEKEVDESYYLSHQYLSGLKKHRARHEAQGNGFGYEVRSRKGIANTIVCGGMGKERNLVKDKILSNCWKKVGDDIQLRNNEGIRKMTPREWARLQGFPENFQFPVSKTRKYRLLGNSVAVPVIEAVASQMRYSLNNGNIVHKIDAYDTQLQIALDLFLKLYEKKAIPKTGKKFVISLESFIEKNYLRIADLHTLLLFLDNMKIIEILNQKQIKIHPKLLIASNSHDFQKIFYDLIQMNQNESIKDKYIGKGIITALIE